MNRKELMRALHDYEKAKATSANAEEKMERVRHILGSKWDYNDTGVYYLPLFVPEEDYIISAISEMKKAYYAHQDLFDEDSWAKVRRDFQNSVKDWNVGAI